MVDLFEEVTVTASLSACRTYRYRLDRVWSEAEPKVAFIMLNPSTADEQKDDPTIRRCIGFAKSWGYGGIVVGNLFALRSTDPKALYTHADPIGPDNDKYLWDIANDCHQVIAAWGTHGALNNRGHEVAHMLNGTNLSALKVTAGGFPGHPLYIAASTQPKAYFATQRVAA
ncbi:DUF1643 domain-containing protein [Sinorhizobium meliloti]|uniref:DUF1643 domain-containing protein n=1 Tax=Rhizobium meliloti TaxID=382 RepID=UPI000488C0DF|nr:DUF1643 domain-containing protein [Sinorhizobium meliloti]